MEREPGGVGRGGVRHGGQDGAGKRTQQEHRRGGERTGGVSWRDPKGPLGRNVRPQQPGGGDGAGRLPVPPARDPWRDPKAAPGRRCLAEYALEVVRSAAGAGPPGPGTRRGTQSTPGPRRVVRMAPGVVEQQQHLKPVF
jgi:hypothetical protein